MAADYSFKNDTNAQAVDIAKIGDVDELPQQFRMEGK